MEKKWCMCTELKGVARDCDSTCSICGGKDAYGGSPERPKDKKKVLVGGKNTTSSNSDYAAAVKNLINSEVDCVQTKNGAYVNLDGVIDCLNRALHDFA